MTAVEWLINQLKSKKWEDWNELVEQAKEMEKQQHGKTWDSAIEGGEKRVWNIIRLYDDFDDYYSETYGSKGSDEITNCDNKISQTEISDEEIYKQADKEFRHFEDEDKDIWIMACQWYREQLKNKQ